MSCTCSLFSFILFVTSLEFISTAGHGSILGKRGRISYGTLSLVISLPCAVCTEGHYEYRETRDRIELCFFYLRVVSFLDVSQQPCVLPLHNFPSSIHV